MARVTYGGGVTEFNGSIGGVTFQKNASGNIAKLRSNPTVNPTALQAKYQTNMAQLVSRWPTLSQVNKDSWDAFATAHDHTTPWGEIKTLSGYQWFMSINLQRLLDSLAALSIAPVFFAYPAPDTFTLEAAAGYLRCSWASPYNYINTLKIFLTLPLRQSSLKLRRSLFYVGKETGSSPISLLDITSEFEALANVTWATFFASADASIICRLQDGAFSIGQFSAFTSALAKID